MGYVLLLFIFLSPNYAFAEVRNGYEKQADPRKLTDEQAKQAEDNYKKYCALCHGENRQGYANDHAPSLRSKSLFESGVPHSILRPLSYGRIGTAMAGYLNEAGGPLTLDDAWNLTYWLFWQSKAHRVQLSEKPVQGDISQGSQLYQTNCASCHGDKGQGISAPALWNPSFLAHNKDEFIRYAIRHGRENTPMQAFSGKLSAQEIDSITAFLRSKANDTVIGKAVIKQLPSPNEYILNPSGEDPIFNLKDNQYVTSEELNKALEEKKRMVLLDTRVPSVWQRAHIKGSIPMPYYMDVDKLISYIPKDIQIVAYCSCPRAASDYYVKKLHKVGYNRTAVLWEGIFGWMNMGYPVTRGELEKAVLDQTEIEAKAAKEKAKKDNLEKEGKNIIQWCYHNCIDELKTYVEKLFGTKIN